MKHRKLEMMSPLGNMATLDPDVLYEFADAPQTWADYMAKVLFYLRKEMVRLDYGDLEPLTAERLALDWEAEHAPAKQEQQKPQ